MPPSWIKFKKHQNFAKLCFHWAISVGQKHFDLRANNKAIPFLLKKQFALADKLVLSKLRQLLGGRIKMMPCGGAKLEPAIGLFFHAIGINIKLGYGMTETTATVSCWHDFQFNPKFNRHTHAKKRKLKLGKIMKSSCVAEW